MTRRRVPDGQRRFATGDDGLTPSQRWRYCLLGVLVGIFYVCAGVGALMWLRSCL